MYAILYLQVDHHISDNGVEHLLRFLFRSFQVLGVDLNCQPLAEFCVGFPLSLYLAGKLVKLDRDDFKRFAVRPSCFTLYDMFDCVSERNGISMEKTKIRGKMVKSNSALVKQVICKGNFKKFYPIKVFCMNSVVYGIENTLWRKDIKDKRQHWQEWEQEPDIMRNVYDGRGWKKCLSYNGIPFLSDKRGVGLMMNIDLLQPFKNKNDYSVGVIYFVLLNLPRNVRFKSENVIIA